MGGQGKGEMGAGRQTGYVGERAQNSVRVGYKGAGGRAGGESPAARCVACNALLRNILYFLIESSNPFITFKS